MATEITKMLLNQNFKIELGPTLKILNIFKEIQEEENILEGNLEHKP